MKKQNLYRYYSFGYNYNLLRWIEGEISNQALLEKLDAYFEFIDELNLSVTRAGIQLHGLGKVHKELQSLATEPEEKNKSADEALLKEVRTRMATIDPILDAELTTRQGYLVEEKRYQSELLMKNMGGIFAKNVFEKIPELARYDFEECGMCLIFDRFTAAAFHVLRGTEEVLRFYHDNLVSNVKKTGFQKTWGSCVQKLEKEVKTGKVNPEPPSELMINLDSLRRYYRNGTQHPELVYSSDKVQDLMGLCVKTVNEMIQDLARRGVFDIQA